MIKRLQQLIGVAAIFSALTAGAQPTEPTYVWGNLLTGIGGQDQTRGIAAYGKDDVYWMAFNGSATGDTDVTYAGKFLYDGSLYDGAGANKNLTLLKTDAKGEAQWTIHSTAGDFVSGEGSVAVNSNGDVVFFGAVRHTDGYFGNGVTLVDATGKTTDLCWNIGDRRNVRLFLATATPEGEIIWARTYDIATDPAPAAAGNNADFTADAVNAYTMTLDSDDNIYIGGRYRSPLTFPKADGSAVTLTPKNVTTWNGDSQKACGDMYVVKLDPEGNYLAHLKESGDEVDITYTWRLKIKDDALYMAGYSQGNGENAIEIGGKRLIPNQYVCPIVAKLGLSLDVQWIELFPGGAVGGKNAVQNVGMSVSDNAVWLVGQYNGRISDPADADRYVESTQGNLREGFIIKLSGNDGSWLGSANSRTDFNENYLTGYLNLVNEDATGTGEVVVFGYAMNSNVGVFLRSYNATTLAGNPDRSWNIVTQGGVPTAQDMIYVPEAGASYLTVRGNKAFQPLGGPLSGNVTGYTNYLSRFDLPLQIQTSSATIPEEDNITRYYTLQGHPVTSPASPGVYIRIRGDKPDKILIR